MNVHVGQKVRVWYSDGGYLTGIVDEINEIGFTVSTDYFKEIQFNSDGFECMQGMDHDSARRVELIPSFHDEISEKLHKISCLAGGIAINDDIVTIKMKHLIEIKNEILNTVKELAVLVQKDKEKVI